MKTSPSTALSSPRVDEPLVSTLLVVLEEVLNATVLHVFDSDPLGHTRNDVEEVLELPEHNTVH